MKIFTKTLLITVFITLTACFSKQKDEIIFTVETIIEEQPDSSLILLNHLKEKRLSKRRQAMVTLLEVMAKDKLGQNISFNTEIFDVAKIILKKGTNEEKAKVLLYSSRVRRENREYENAMNYAIEAKEYGFQTNDNDLKGLIMANIGDIIFEENHNDSALNYYKEAFYHFNKTENYSNQIITLKLIGNCFLKINNKDSALNYYNSALTISEEHDNLQQSGVLINMGALYNKYDDYTNSLYFFKKAISKAENHEDSLLTYLNIANIYYCLSNLDSANYYINQCLYFLNISDLKVSPETYISAYGMFSEINEERGNLKYVDKLDAIHNEISKEKIVEIKEQYNNIKLQNDYQTLKLQRQNIVLFSFSLIISLIIIILTINRKRINTEKELLLVLRDFNALRKMAEIEIDNNAELIHNQFDLRLLLLDYFKVTAKVEKLINENVFDSELSKEEIIKKAKNIIYKDTGKLTFDALKRIAPQLIESIKKINSKLSDTEIIICILTYLGFDNQDIVTYTGLSLNVIHTRSSDIRKKLGIELKGSIKDYFTEKLVLQ